jgi:hypothetical protein
MKLKSKHPDRCFKILLPLATTQRARNVPRFFSLGGAAHVIAEDLTGTGLRKSANLPPGDERVNPKCGWTLERSAFQRHRHFMVDTIGFHCCSVFGTSGF